MAKFLDDFDEVPLRDQFFSLGNLCQIFQSAPHRISKLRGRPPCDRRG